MERKLQAASRDGRGKGAARKLRAQGKVPAVLYGHGIDPVTLAVDQRELYHLLHTDAGMNVLVDLHVDGERHLAIPREVQRDVVRGEFLHADFLKIARDEKITVNVPIQLVGESSGVREGGVIEHHLWEVSVECLPTDVPESVEADISELAVGDSVKVVSLRVPDVCTVVTPPEETIASVVPPPVLKLEEEAAEEVAEGVEGERAAEEAALAEPASEGGEPTSGDAGESG